MTPAEEIEEGYLQLLASLGDLIRSDHIAVDDRLEMLDHAVALALGATTGEAKDWVDKAVLGMIGP